MLRHACGFALANKGHDTRALQAYLGHKNIQHTVLYTDMAPTRFKDFWRHDRPRTQALAAGSVCPARSSIASNATTGINTRWPTLMQEAAAQKVDAALRIAIGAEV